jgi:hypothetical protein
MRDFNNKEKEYLKDKINEPAKNSKDIIIRELYRGVNEFKRGLHCRFPQCSEDMNELLLQVIEYS